MQRAAGHRVTIHSDEGPPLLLGHGLGGRPNDWQPLVEAFRPAFRVITFAQAGSLDADPGLFAPERHGAIVGFADDLSLLCAELGLRQAVFIGHSLGAMAGALAAAGDPGLFTRLVLLNASACYIDDPPSGYRGGFSSDQVEELLRAIRSDVEAWASGFGPLVMGRVARPEDVLEFVRVLRDLDPVVTTTCFRAAFRSDCRALMARITAPTLVLQSDNDPAVPLPAAVWLASAMADASLQRLPCEGHFPHVVDPAAVIAAIRPFLQAVLP